MDKLLIILRYYIVIGGGLLQTCVLRPSGIYGPEERRHLHRVMVRPLISTLFPLLPSLSLSDLSQIPDSCTLQAQLCQCAQSCTILMESVRSSCYSMCFCCACTYRHMTICTSTVTQHADIFLFLLLLHTDTLLSVLLLSLYIQKHAWICSCCNSTYKHICLYRHMCGCASSCNLYTINLVIYSPSVKAPVYSKFIFIG